MSTYKLDALEQRIMDSIPDPSDKEIFLIYVKEVQQTIQDLRSMAIDMMNAPDKKGVK